MAPPPLARRVRRGAASSTAPLCCFFFVVVFVAALGLVNGDDDNAIQRNSNRNGGGGGGAASSHEDEAAAGHPVDAVGAAGAAVAQPAGGQGAAGPPAPPNNAPRRPMQKRGPQGPAWKIAEEAACTDDVKHLCPKNTWGNNFAVLECLQDNPEVDDKISPDCHHLLWNYKHNLTTDERFDVAAGEVCKTALQELKECQGQERGKGYLISCLIDNRPNITDYQCHQFVTRMTSIVFSDYRMICGFVENCKQDINRLQCGRIGADPKDLHSQGAVVSCLEKALTDENEQNQGPHLQEECKKSILRVAELSSDDFHLDRQLYFACHSDRERFCEKVTAGEGRVYKCLFNHKFEDDMTDKCRVALTMRQKLITQDYKVSYSLAKACRADLKKFRCTGENLPRAREARLSYLLLCLESAVHKGRQVSSDCQAEMLDFRRMLMEDFSLSPEIMLSCRGEIDTRCSGLHRKGRTLHCLMRAVRGEDGKAPLVQSCQTALQELVQEANPGADYRIDRALNEACESVIQTACKHIRNGDPMILSCLMEHLYTDHMVEDCEQKLLELQYFISRDWKLDPILYRHCQGDAARLCHTVGWNDTSETLPPGAVFSCLYRHAHRTESQGRRLSRDCKHEVRRILQQRALDVHLNPELQESCLADLGKWCSEKPGKELECLQDKLDELLKPCKDIVTNLTEMESEDIEIEALLMRACEPIIQAYCHTVADDKGETDDLMECLVENKHQKEINEKCYIGITHFQLIQMKDFRFSFKFKTACKEDVLKLCPNIRRKSDVVFCLSSMVRNDTLLESKDQRVSVKCRKQLRVEELEMTEDLRLDPELSETCEPDIKKFCKEASFGNAQVLECLKDKRKNLSPKCHEKLFKREEQEMSDPEMDYTLMRVCKQMIKRFCSESDPRDIMQCLKQNKHSEVMDPKCKQMITKRQIVQYSDYRLNPILKKSCKGDIPKFCKAVLEQEKNDEELEGKVISCLKLKYGKQRMSMDCEDQIRLAIQESAMDYRLDPQLQMHCGDDISKLCADEAAAQEQAGQVEECLKINLPKIKSEGCRTEVFNILQESKADVFVDPVLHTACSLDLKHYCGGVAPGEGKQMSCLLESLDDKTVRLQPECKKRLVDRKEMWEYAAKVVPPDSLGELAKTVYDSPSRTYFLIVILAAICVLFAFGLLCGRITKRVARDVKDR
ncbi:Golgi apparatus protein 1 [Lampetra fluviatilis]